MVVVQAEDTNQKADGTLFEIVSILLEAWVARCQLGLKNEPPQLLIIDLPMPKHPLRPRVLLIHHLPPPSYVIPHQIPHRQKRYQQKVKESSPEVIPFSLSLIPQISQPYGNPMIEQ